MNCNPVSVCCSSQGCAYLGTSWGLPAACTQLYEESPWGCVTMLCLAGCPWCPYCPQCPVRWCVLWWIVSRQSDKDTVTRWHCTVCILARYTDVYIVKSGARYVCIRTDRGTWSRWRGVPRLAAVLRAVSGVTKWLEVLATDCYHQTGAGLIDSKQTSQHFLNAPHTCGCKCITWYNLRILRLTHCISNLCLQLSIHWFSPSQRRPISPGWKLLSYHIPYDLCINVQISCLLIMFKRLFTV